MGLSEKNSEPTKYKVFLSYAWRDSALRALLVKKLQRIKNSQLIFDQQLPDGDEIYEWVRTAISQCDLVVVLLTSDSISSPWVTVELTIAHELRKGILPVVEKGLATDALLPFIRNVKTVQYDKSDAETTVLRVKDAIRRFQSSTHLASSGENLAVANRPPSRDRLLTSPPRGLFEGKFLQVYMDIFEGNDAHIEGFKACLRRKLIEEKYLYMGSDEALAWRQLCQAPGYRPYHESYHLVKDRFQDALTTIRRIYDGALDLVCMGIGSGDKEQLIIHHLLAHQPKLNFYPIDASEDMISYTIRDFVASFGQKMDSIRFTGILGDFDNLPTVQYIYQDPPRNLFVMLGNTLGNFPDNRIVPRIYRAMMPGDFLIVDTEIAPSGIVALPSKVKASYEMPEYKRHVFACLRKCGLHVETDGQIVATTNHRHLPQRRLSDSYTVSLWFNPNKSLRISYAGLDEVWEPSDSIELGYSIKYSEDAVKDILEKDGRFEVLEVLKAHDGYYAMFVARKLEGSQL